MRILMINASPKKNGATEQVLQWMKEALEEQYETESVCLGEQSIAFCRGCKQCYKTGWCVLPADGVEELLHRMERNDAILFAVPSYWGDVPAQFKALIDRCTPYADSPVILALLRESGYLSQRCAPGGGQASASTFCNAWNTGADIWGRNTTAA